MTPDDLPSRFAVDLSGADLLGIYRVEKKLADGGMGSVWLGEDTNLGRRVVVKVPHVRFLGEDGFRARFTREITELVRLEHPNIVRILAQGTHDEIPFFVLQYLGGGSLEDRLEEAGDAPRGVDTVLPWLRTIAATLDFIHGRGVVHRDVKPENILFDEEGHVFLSDFGVVKALDEDLKVTEAGTGVGSPMYMAPEQGFGKTVDGAADQYGLATVVYQAISGRLPFEGGSVLEMFLQKQKEPPTHLADLAPDLPTACADAVMRGLAADPGERFPSCEDFADAFLAGAGIFDRTPPTGTAALGEPEQASTGRRLLTSGATVALLAAVVLSVGFAAGWFSPAAEADRKPAFGVTLLSPGAKPWHALRYHPAPGTEQTVVVSMDSDESKRIDGQEPTVVEHAPFTMRVKTAVTGVAGNGDISFAWTLVDPPTGWTGTGRQSACGIHLDLGHDTPPPERADALMLRALLTDILEQISTPLPEEKVGIGARWEVTNARNHIEGIRVTQTMSFELVSLTGNEAHLRMYIAVAALHQDLEHPDVPENASARLVSVHGDGDGDLVVDLDQIGDRTVRMNVNTRTELSITEGGEEKLLTLVRKLRYESRRE